jgi:hypothetical protein
MPACVCASCAALLALPADAPRARFANELREGLVRHVGYDADQQPLYIAVN